jgi:Pyruvate/2-oxoacid:ferredoxin oxidoreductase delta subunit
MKGLTAMLPEFMHRIVQPSTLRFFREGRALSKPSFIDVLHGYLYGRWVYLYIALGTGEHPLAKRLAPLFSFLWKKDGSNGETISVPSNELEREHTPFADGYHGKVVPLNSATQLVTIQKDIAGTFPEQVIPYPRARDIVLQNPDHIAVMHCPCRTSRKNPCQPLDVCLIIGEPFASFVLAHHPGRARMISQEEAVDILKAEDERGHVHHAFFKDAMLNRFYAICNCCSCCCGAMQAHSNGSPMLASSGYVSTVDEDLCCACGECVDHCQFGAAQLIDGWHTVDHSRCMGCGVCIGKCEQGALSLVRDPSKGQPLEICALIAEAERTKN